MEAVAKARFVRVPPRKARQVADLIQADRERYAEVLRRVKVTVD